MKRVAVVVVAAVLVLGSVGGGLAWYEWTRSPAYSLQQIARAVEHRDRYEFEKYVDLDGVLQAAAADVSDGNALASAFSGAVAASAKPQIIKAVEDGQIAGDSPIAKSLAKLRSSEARPALQREGRNAYFTVDVTTNGGASFALKFHMTQVADGSWRIDRMANLKELRAVEAEEERARKAAIARANEAKLAELAVIAKLHTSRTEGPWGLQKKNRFQIRFENKSDKHITAMTGHIRFPAQDFDEVVRGQVDLAPGEASNFSWSVDANQFIEPTMRIFRLGETEDFVVDVDSLTYAGGAKVKRGSEE